MKRMVLLTSLILLSALFTMAQSRRPITFDDLIGIKRVGDAQLSPDGKLIAYTVMVYNKSANSKNSDIWVVPTAGGEARQITTSAQADSEPRWSPDSRKIAFTSGRGGESQIWILDANGGEARKLMHISSEASGPLWSPDGKWIAFVSDVYPDCKDDACNKQMADKAAQSKVKAKELDHLLYRHWSSWKDGQRSHLFIVSADGGDARDVTPGNYDVPPFSLGGPTDYAFSPDSKEIAFVRNTDKVEATSTNGDIFVVSVSGGEAKRITTNPGMDNSPLYSPDGRYIAYRSQAQGGFESDRWRLFVYDRQTAQHREVTDIDLWVDGMAWSSDSKKLYFSAEDKGESPIFVVLVSGGKAQTVIDTEFNDGMMVSPDGKSLVFTRQSMTEPTEVFRANIDGQGITKLTHTNDALMATLDLAKPESIWFEGAEKAKVHGWIVKPPQFDASKKWPMILLIHGGPQGAWGDNFGYRWNPHMFAATGYVVVMINPRGSTGYGQKFTDEISDWGGKVYTDLMNGVDHVVNLGYIDKDHIGAAGGSYGGYIIDWIEGHNQDGRFKALVSHDGVYNLTSMYGTTEELWFPEWELKGNPWDNPEVLYEMVAAYVCEEFQNSAAGCSRRVGLPSTG